MHPTQIVDHVHDESEATTFKSGVQTQTTLRAVEDQANESQPLLPQAHESRAQRSQRLPSSRTILLLLFAVVTVTSFADQIQEAPRTRILESIICYKYYEATDRSKILLSRDVVGPGAIGGVDELDCKVGAVAGELAVLGGYMQMFSYIPGLILGVPVGWLADRYGRWTWIFLNLLQFLLATGFIQIVTYFWQAFDIRMIWLGAGLSVLGGGDAVVISLLYVTISDVVSEADRAAAFLRLSAVNVSANLFMPLIAAALMTINPWIPYLIATGLFALAAIGYLFVPETKDYQMRLAASNIEECQATDAIESLLINASSDIPVPIRPSDRWASRFASHISFLWNDWRILALILPFLGHQLSNTTGPLLLQYVSKRYALTMSVGTLLTTTKNGATTLILFIVLPWLSDLVMKRYGYCSRKKDLYLARASQVLFAAGWAFLAASPNWPTSIVSLVVVSAGHGAMVLARSFLTSLLDSQHVASVYSIMGVADNLGAIFGAPLLAAMFQRGVALGPAWIGLPFYFIGSYSALFALILFMVPIKKGELSTGLSAE